MKKIFLVLFSLLLAVPLFAQVSVDPDDTFYTLVEAWEIRGLIDEVPPLRPFPIKNIRDILQSVMENGNERDKRNAELYWEKVTGKPWNLSLQTDLTYKKDAEKEGFGDAHVGIYPDFNGDISLFDEFVSMGYSIGLAAYNNNVSDYLAVYENDSHDAIHDAASVGPLEVYLDMNDILAVGTKNIFAQIGIYRSGYGPFINSGLALNDNSYHRTNLSFTTVNPRWSYTQQYSTMGATLCYDGSDLAPDKYMAFHALEFKFLPQLSVAYYETIVFGRRLDPSYLIPAPFMVAQGIGGFNDNLQMGLIIKYRPYKGILWATDIFVDDISVDDVVKLDFDTKIRVAFKTGIIYTPVDSYCSRLALDYTVITPFTYTHWDYDDPNRDCTISSHCFNFQNYTNNGVPIGQSYPPNTDRIALTINFIPVPPLHIQVMSSFMRHANVCESYTTEEAVALLRSAPGTYSTDGSINTHANMGSSGSIGSHIDTAWDKLNYLTQPNRMYVLQEGFSVDYSFKKYNWGQFSLHASYLFEWVKNRGVDSHLYPGQGSNIVDNGNGTYNFDGNNNLTGEELVEYFHSRWEDGLRDEINNYFTIGFKYQF